MVGDTVHKDIIIIGGGIMGAAISYYCSKAGLDVTVLEKRNWQVARLPGVMETYLPSIKTLVLIVKCL